MAAAQGPTMQQSGGLVCFFPDSSWFCGELGPLNKIMHAFERTFSAGLLWLKHAEPGAKKDLFSITGIEIEDQCPCMVDRDGSVDGVQYLIQAAHKSGARFRWTACRAGASLPRLSGQHMSLLPEFDLSGTAGAGIIRQVFPSVASAAGASTLEQSSIVLLSGWCSEDIQLQEAQVLADVCLVQHAAAAPGASQTDRVLAMGELGEKAVVVDLSQHGSAHSEESGHHENCTALSGLATVLPVPTGVSDFALSAACTSAGEGGTGMGAHAPAVVARLLRKRRRTEASNAIKACDSYGLDDLTLARSIEQHQRRRTGIRSGRPAAVELHAEQWYKRREASKNSRVAPMSTVSFECLRNGVQVAWVPEVCEHPEQ